MTRYGTWRPLDGNWAAQPAMRTHDVICLHTMVGTLAGTDAYFRQNGYGGVESHFGVGHDGTVYQWQDTARQAEANLGGNGRLISIETADRGAGFPRWDGSDVPAWTDAQVGSLAKLIAFLCDAHDIPRALIPDSKPGRRGIGYHRLGIEPWRVAGGEVWSNARGKVCPGDRRIAQLPGIIVAAQGGGAAPSTFPTIRRGDTGPAVERIQRFLGVVAPGEPGWGVFGPKTEEAVRQYQRLRGITVDGVVGPATWRETGLK